MAADMFPALILQTPVAGFTGYLPSVINSDSFQLSKKKKFGPRRKKPSSSQSRGWTCCYETGCLPPSFLGIPSSLPTRPSARHSACVSLIVWLSWIFTGGFMLGPTLVSLSGNVPPSVTQTHTSVKPNNSICKSVLIKNMKDLNHVQHDSWLHCAKYSAKCMFMHIFLCCSSAFWKKKQILM